MPSITVQADTTGKTAFTVPLDKIGRISFIEIDNQSGSEEKIELKDKYTPDSTESTPSPTQQTPVLKQLTVAAGDDVSWTDENMTIEVFGQLDVIASVTDSSCIITVGFEYE